MIQIEVFFFLRALSLNSGIFFLQMNDQDLMALCSNFVRCDLDFVVCARE